MTTKTALKWHGGKSYLADWIVSHFPPRCRNPNAPADDDDGYLHYVEPYFGGGSVLLANDPNGISEVVNDLNGQLTKFWRILQDERTVTRLIRRLQVTPFSEIEFAQQGEELDWPEEPNVDHFLQVAFAFFIRCRQSMSGRMKSFAPLSRTRTRQGMNEQAAAWMSAVDGLPEIHARLRRVVILNRPAVEVIKQQDGSRTLFYCDPPYLHETRATTKEYGEQEMTADDHAELLTTLAGIKGRFVLSGYPSALYADFAQRYGWRTETKMIDNKSSKAENKELKAETLWMNY